MNLPLANTDCKVQMNLTNIDYVGHNDLCKVVSPNYSETPKTDICKTGDYKEPDYMESNSFTSNVRIGEPKVFG